MYRKNIGCVALSSLLFCSSLLYAQEDQTSLSESAVQGEAAFAICQSCHDASLDPPKAPPMYGVQRRYNRQYENQQEFVDAIVKFVSKPTEDGALMKHPIKKLGLMPALPLGDDNLSKIATYIYEENFEPPCDHWANAISAEKGKGRHREQVQSNYNELCK